MKGLPFKAHVNDVINFYGDEFGLSACNVFMRRHADGRLNGEVRNGCGAAALQRRPRMTCA